MRICFFSPTFLPSIGGAESSADVLVRGLIKRGHDVHMLAQEQSSGQAQVPYPLTYYRRPFAQHLRPEVLARPLRKLYKQWPYDVILAFYSYPTGYAASRIKRSLGVGLVISPRGKDLSDRFFQHKRFRRLAVMRAGYRGADRIVAISCWLADRLREEISPSSPPIDVVYNGIDLDEHDKQLCATRSGRIAPLLSGRFVLHMARVTAGKQQMLAVRAVEQLRSTFETAGLQYAIVGDGRDLTLIRRFVEQQKLQHIVKLLGARVGQEKFWLLDNAVFFVTTSSQEALGCVVVEAMASGLPIVASDLPPHRELIEGKGWGLLFARHDLPDLIEKMKQMIDADRKPMQEQAHHCREQFTLKVMIDGYEKACRDVLQGAGNGA